MMEQLTISDINGIPTVLSGIGNLFYESGFPIHITVDILKEKGIKVSVLHIADELYKNGWTERAIVNCLSQDFDGCEQLVSDFITAGLAGDKRTEEPPVGQQWIYSQDGYENQREMIFNSLFGYSSAEAMADSDKREALKQYLN